MEFVVTIMVTVQSLGGKFAAILLHDAGKMRSGNETITS